MDGSTPLGPPPPIGGLVNPVLSSLEEDDNTSSVTDQLNALPSVQISLPGPVTDEQNKLLQKTLDRYQITPATAVTDSRAIAHGLWKGATYMRNAVFPKLPVIPRWLPVAPIAASYACDLGYGKTALLFASIGISAFGIGCISGLAEEAEKLHKQTPEESLAIEMKRLQDNLSYHLDRVLEARLVLLKKTSEWNQLTELKLDLDKLQGLPQEFTEAMTILSDYGKEVGECLFERELNKQAKKIQALREKKAALAKNINSGDDSKLEILKTEFDLQIEEDAQYRLQRALKSQKQQLITDVSGHIEKQQFVINTFSKNAKSALFAIYRDVLSAQSKLSSSWAAISDTRQAMILLRTDEELIRLARQQNITATTKEHKGSSA